MNEEDNKKKRLKLYYGLLVTLICIVGVSFAWFRLYLSQSENNVISTRTCFDTTLTEDTSKITLTDAFPISDEDGLKQTPFTFTLKNNCSSYVKAYITIDSTYRESTDSSYLNDKYVRVNVSPNGTTSNNSVTLGNRTLTNLENNNKGYVIINAGLGANEEKSYDLRVWVDSETTLEQGLDKNWSGKIVVITEASNEEATLKDAILANNTITEPLTTPGRQISAYTLADANISTAKNGSIQSRGYYITYGTGWKANGTGFDLTGTSVTSETYANSYSSLVGKYLPSVSLHSAGSSTPGEMAASTNLESVYYIIDATLSSLTYKELTSNKNITEALLASTEDDYGTSYYFRGTVRNNYVQFANKCWRIVRITGDGSVKLVLHNDNVSGSSSPCTASNNDSNAAFARYSGTTYTSAFNLNNDDNAYIGFMYGVPEINNYANTHANINKSTILTNLETWYKNNLVQFEDKLADIIWCNDKSTFTTYTSGSTYGTGLGYGINKTGYGTYNRIYGGDAASSAAPSLICQNDDNGGKLSKFTVNDTTNGNGNLTYRIGLLTADEIAFAGYTSYLNNTATYLQENAADDWWLLSPYGFNGVADVWSIVNGYLYNYYEYAMAMENFSVNNTNNGIRPAIALTSDVLISDGSGTSEDPYTIK